MLKKVRKKIYKRKNERKKKESYKKELLPNPPSTAYFFHSLGWSEATLSRAQRDQAKRA